MAKDTFRFEVSLAISESQLVAWFEQAEPGDRVVYCEGFVALSGDPAWQLAGAWQREGLVHLITERDGRKTRWMAERRPLGCDRIRAARRTPQEDFTRVQMRALLDELRSAAARGLPCPSVGTLARAVTGANRVTVKHRNRVSYLRKRLVEDGKIAVIPGGPNRGPVVTILARGKGCGMSTKGEV